MNTRSRTLSTLLASSFFILFLGACSSHELATEETVQPTEEQGAALSTETEKAIAEASSADFTEPSEVQLDGGIETAVDTVDNTPTPEPVATTPDLMTESSLEAVDGNAAIYFAKSSARVSREYRDQLQEIAGKWASDHKPHITLRGHCDQRGSAAFNRRLAVKRARAVKAALVRMGVRSRQITIGSAQLASSGSTEEEHARNRRVEVEFP